MKLHRHRIQRTAMLLAITSILAYPSAAAADEGKNSGGHDSHGGSHSNHTTPAKPAPTAAAKPATTAKPDSATPTQPDAHSSHSHGIEPAASAPSADSTKGANPDSHGSGGHSHGSGPVTETPPNLPVLGSFAAVNGAFLLYGLRNKLTRKKGGETP